ncbi:MAG: GDP-mannose 4,6-dehydratase [Acidimicrobiales bacterium]
MRALITGGRGFVGAHLCAHLIAEGDDVTSVDRDCDVTDLDALRAVVRASQPDVVYHLAALTHVGDSWTNQNEFTRVNVLGSKNLLDAVRLDAPEASVILVSSSEVYGVVHDDDLPLGESFRTAPANPYSASKLEAERIAREAHRDYGQRVVIARPFNHVGPGQTDTFVIPALVNRLLEALERGREEIPVGDLSTRRDFSDVRDVVRAYRLLALHGRSGEVYNVASGHDVAISDIASRLRDEIAPNVALVVDPTLLRPVEVPVTRGRVDKIHEATGWEPEISLTRSLHDVIEDIRTRRSRAGASPK